jgi:PAS domain S-box-containing protein
LGSIRLPRRGRAYIVTTLGLLGALAIRFSLDRYLGNAPPFVFFALPVFLGAWLGGFRTGIYATLLSLASGWYFFVPPRYEWIKGNLDIATRFVIFMTLAVGMSAFGSHLRRIQMDARRNEKRFRSLFQNAAVGMAQVGLDGRWMQANDRLCEILGVSKRELFETTVWPKSEAAPDWAERLLRHRSNNESVEKSHVRPDGTSVWVTFTVTVQIDDRGKPAHFIAVIEDITERKRAEEAMRVNLLQLQATFEGMVEPALLLNVDETIMAMNPSFQALFEFKARPARRDEILNHVLLLRPDGQRLLPDENPVDRALRGEIVRDQELKVITKSGRAVHIVCGSAPICDIEGRIAAVILTTHDITDRKLTEQALQRTNHILREFAYAAAHDLQEPLRNVSLSSELLSRRYQERFDDEARDLIATSAEGARRMHALIRDLLEYTRIVEQEQGAPPVTGAEAALDRALANLSRPIRQSGAQITHDPLPAVAVHEAHLVQLFQNLVSNGLKYRKRDVPPHVHIAAEQRNGDIVFHVTDNGIGFEPALSRTIFGLFKRLHDRKDYPGTGIGLAICERITEHYGGRIWADSQPGEGATFSFALPSNGNHANG